MTAIELAADVPVSARARYLERQRRYNASEKGRARWARYEKTEKGRERHERQIRMSCGGINFYLGSTPTVEQAQQIRQAIKELPRGTA